MDRNWNLIVSNF